MKESKINKPAKYVEAGKRAWDAILVAVKELEQSGVKRIEVARRLCVSRSVITAWLNGERESPNASFPDMLLYLEVLGLDIFDYLPQEMAPKATIHRLGANSPIEVVEGENLPSVPVVGATGAGDAVELFSATPEKWLQVLPQYEKPNMVAFEVEGDSMEPTIRKGAYVGVVPFNGEIQEGGIYLVQLPPFGRSIKRIKMGADGCIELHSDNPKYAMRPIPFEGYGDIILGKVAWVWQNV